MDAIMSIVIVIGVFRAFQHNIGGTYLGLLGLHIWNELSGNVFITTITFYILLLFAVVAIVRTPESKQQVQQNQNFNNAVNQEVARREAVNQEADREIARRNAQKEEAERVARRQAERSGEKKTLTKV